MIENVILDLVRRLKKEIDPLNSRISYEFYLIDKDYDVKVIVKLLPKKSQYKLGMEMFNGK